MKENINLKDNSVLKIQVSHQGWDKLWTGLSNVFNDPEDINFLLRIYHVTQTTHRYESTR